MALKSKNLRVANDFSPFFFLALPWLGNLSYGFYMLELDVRV